MSFNSDIRYNSGSNLAAISQIQYEIPIFNEDRLTYQIDPTNAASTMTFGVFLGIYQDGYQVKKIRLEDSNGDEVVLNASDANAVQGNSDKTSHQSSTTHQFFTMKIFRSSWFLIQTFRMLGICLFGKKSLNYIFLQV